MTRTTFLAGVAAVSIAAAMACRNERTSAGAASSPTIDSLPSPAARGSGEPYLAAAPDGRVFMTWLEPADSGHALRFATLRDTQWSAAQTIRRGRDFFVNWADFPSVEVLDGGRLAVHWLQRNGAGTYAYGVRIAQSTDSGKSWTPPVTPHRDSSQTEHGFVAMWQDGGTLGAVWLDGRKFTREGHNAANEMMLISTTLDATGMRGPETRLDERTCDCCQNTAVMTADGPLIAYRNRSADEIRDIHVTRRVAGKWTPGVPVHADNWKIDACPVNGPAAAASGRTVALAWFTAANDSARVKVAFSDDAGATFGSPVRVDDGNPAGRVDVTLAENGDALVTWIERTGGDTAAVRARRVTRAGSVGSPVTIATSSAARASGFPRMALSGEDVVFAWTVPGRPSAVRVARGRIGAIR